MSEAGTKRMPNLKGFTVERASAYWIVCDTCGDSELVYGEGKEDTARQWAKAHGAECPSVQLLGAEVPPEDRE